jgi:hypothetical protein
VQDVLNIVKFLGRISVFKNGYELKSLETLKTSMLNIEPMWKCGRDDAYFNDTFCVFMGIQNRPIFGVVQHLLCVAIPLCAC